MSSVNKFIVIITVVLSLFITAMQVATGTDTEIDNVGGLATVNGQALLVSYENNFIELRVVDSQGVIRQSASMPRIQDNKLVSVADVGVDSANTVYLLLDLSDSKTGKLQRQELALYNLSGIFRKLIVRHELSSETKMRYRWLSVTSAVVLMGTDTDEKTLTREAYDPPTLAARAMPKPQSVRTYPINDKEGIYQAVIAGTNIAYTSRSGKVFVTSEEQQAAREVYPARTLTKVMYPLFIAPCNTDSVYIGEQESGDILQLTLASGETTQQKPGTEPFSGNTSYAPVNIRSMSMTDPLNFSALVRSSARSAFDLLICKNGEASEISALRQNMLMLVLQAVLRWLCWAAGILLVLQAIHGFFYVVGKGRTILLKLMFSTLPLVIVALSIFGAFSYTTYRNSVETSFQKQVEDEGNMLTALFGAESFDEIEYPYDYTKEAYSYLIRQMKTRQTYTSSAYYEREQLFVGVDAVYPCFYPFDIRLNAAASDLYRQAAYTGKQQTGVVNDAFGRRIVCITPIGGVSGGTVYLLETGILAANLDDYTDTYLRNYVIVAASFIIAIGLILTLVFTRILRPIGEIKNGLTQFSKGNRTILLENNATDEFSDIIRMFNKMATDIEAQIYSLRQANDTYFRFIPPKMLQLLGKENLGEIELGSSVDRECHIICAGMEFNRAGMRPSQEQELTGSFFSAINLAADRFGATLVADSMNLRRVRVICANGNTAVDIALAALIAIDGLNAGLPLQNRMQAQFVVHKTHIRYAICGGQERMVPALFSAEVDYFAEHEEQLRRFTSRLLVTAAAMEDIEKDHYFNRFIGYPQDGEREQYGLYEFYDACSVEQTSLINETRATFDKAMQLYLEGRWYDAKSLFALVLRQNQYDNVTRHYIFSCEKNLQLIPQ